MNLNRIIVTLLISVALLSFATAQTRRRPAAKPPATKPAPADNSAAKTTAPAVQPSPTQPAEVTTATLAVINDVTISASDIEDQVSAIINRDPDPYLRSYYADPQKETMESRQRAFDARVNSLLIAAEAKKRGKTSDQIIEAEMNSKVPTPTEAEIQAAYDANRNQIGTATLESVRAELINYIRNERSQELYAALIRRLKMTNAVNKNADVNAPNLAPGTVLAAVNGEPGWARFGCRRISSAVPLVPMYDTVPTKSAGRVCCTDRPHCVTDESLRRRSWARGETIPVVSTRNGSIG